jgi:hypothetical protein
MRTWSWRKATAVARVVPEERGVMDVMRERMLGVVRVC